MRTFRKLQCPSWSPSFSVFYWVGRDYTLAPVASRGAPPSRPLEIIQQECTTRGHYSTSEDTIRHPRTPFDTPKEKRELRPPPQPSNANWAEVYYPRASFDTPKKKRELRPPPQPSKANWAEVYHPRVSFDPKEKREPQPPPLPNPAKLIGQRCTTQGHHSTLQRKGESFNRHPNPAKLIG